MKRLRLNKDKRDMLWTKAYNLIMDTPVPSAALAKSIDLYEKAHAKAHEAVLKAIAKRVTNEDMRTVTKLKLPHGKFETIVVFHYNDKTSSTETVEFRMIPEARLKNESLDWQKKRKRDQSRGIYAKGYENDPAQEKRHKLVEEKAVEIPIAAHGSSGNIGGFNLGIMIDTRTRELIAKTGELLKDYEVERKAFDEAMKPTLDAVRAVIASAMFFDEVIKYWPEAAQFAHLVADEPSTALSVVSPDAVKLIAENMKARGIEVEQAS